MRALPPEYRERELTIQPWVERGYDRSAVELVLSLVVKAFGWSKGEALRLRPDDAVWGIYRDYYPPLTGWRRWIGDFRPDELELETLLRDLRKRAPPDQGVDLDPSVTIGGLVKMVEAWPRDSAADR
jgi:hypothetical protein